MMFFRRTSPKFWRGVLLAVVAVMLFSGGGYLLGSYFRYLARKDIALPMALPSDRPRAYEPKDWPAVLGAVEDEPFPYQEEHEGGMVLPETDGLDAIPGDYILSGADRLARERLAALARRHGITVLDQFGSAIRIRVSDQQRLMGLLRELPGAVDVEVNIRMRIPPLDDPGASMSAPSTPYRGFGDQALAWLGVPAPEEDWGRGIKVAVLDTGISGTPVVQKVNFVGTSEDGVHGSLVAGILASLLPGADLLDMQVMGADGTGDAFTVAKGIRAAVDAGAQIINMSIGTRGESRVLAAAVQYAIEQGVLIVASAGNEGLERLSYPAAYDGVLSVAAVDAAEQHLHLSNRGERVDLAAPGVGISVVLDDGQIASFTGTSAAAPFVSATAGLALALDGKAEPATLRDLLIFLANDSGEPGVNALTGAGIVSPLRVLEHHQPGIVDMGVLRPYFDTDASGTVLGVSVAAENRGTVDLAAVEMVVTVNERTYHLAFEEVGRGQTVAHRLEAGREFSADAVVDMTLQVQVPGDVRPENNALRSVRLPVSLDDG